MNQQNRPKKRKAIDRSPIHLENFGCATEMRFGKRGTIRIQMNSVEFGRLLDALAVYEIRSKRLQKYQILKAAEVLKNGFGPLSSARACVTADVIIAQHGVRLEPIDLTIDEQGKLVEVDAKSSRDEEWEQ